ncbi:hypothetical protein [Pseudescherichia sp.]|uniref:hypothetical protein n=1 Tax=Pseudescherichia sp. TaxID=2055881 RepID=UPI0028A04CFA|nr:hypothetical protein [Pseudescherichia sp.]
MITIFEIKDFVDRELMTKEAACDELWKATHLLPGVVMNANFAPDRYKKFADDKSYKSERLGYGEIKWIRKSVKHTKDEAEVQLVMARLEAAIRD